MASSSVLLGSSDFEEFVTKNVFLVDKTEFIKDFMQGPPVSVILRPRRFGKSMNLSMLNKFLSAEFEYMDFSNLVIGQDIPFCTAHRGKYMTVHISFMGCGAETWEETKEHIWEVLRQAVLGHIKHGELDLGMTKEIEFNSGIPPRRFETILLRLTRALFQKYRKKVIVLIDEHDAPLYHASRNGYYPEAASFFRKLYAHGLKNNDAVEKACLMGIIEVGGGMIFSGLNNLIVYSVADKTYSKYFGFTIEEIKEHCEGHLYSVLSWYHGYHIGDYKLINPWSFSSWLCRNKVFGSYWVGTATVESFESELSEHKVAVFREVIKDLYFDGPGKHIDQYSTVISYEDSLDHSSVWNLLINSGYLSFIPSTNNIGEGYALIPNNELRLHWQNVITRMLTNNAYPAYHEGMKKALRDFNVAEIASQVKILVDSASCFDLVNENSYHLLCFGLLKTVFMNSLTTEVTSNVESGKGRYDIAIKFEGLKAIIIEIKLSSSSKELEADASKALKQIVDTDHMARFPGYSFLLVGVSFYRKEFVFKHANYP